MNNSILRISVAAVLSTACAQAYAVSAPPANTNVLLVSGATAQERTLFEGLMNATSGLCSETPVVNSFDPADVADVYFAAGAGTTSPQNFTVFCKSAGRPGSLAVGTVFGVGKESGGSETGILPVATGNPTAIPNGTVDFADPNSAGDCTGPTNVVATATNISYRQFTNCGLIVPSSGGTLDTNSMRLGLSDVEPRLFGTASTGLTVESGVAVPFGPAVSRNFFNALQTAQGLNVNGACPDVGVSGNFATTADCLPQLSTAQVRGLYSGGILNVGDLRVGSAGLNAPGADSAIRICRRSDSSGTQKSFEQYFFQTGCVAQTATQFVSAAQTTDPDNPNVIDGNEVNCRDTGCTWPQFVADTDISLVTTRIFQLTGSGDVEACLDDADDRGIFAIGVLSMDRVPTNTTREFRYVALDGNVPTLQNVVDGAYNFFSEAVINTRTGTTGNINTIANGVKAQLRNPTLLAATLTNMSLGAGTGGLLVRPVPGVAPGAVPVSVTTRPVNTQVKQASYLTTTVNNCIPPAFKLRTQSPVDNNDAP